MGPFLYENVLTIAKITKNCFFVLKSMTSWWPGLPDVSETRLRPSPTSNPPAEPQPQAQACLKTGLPASHPASPAQRSAQPRPRLISTPVPRSGLSETGLRPDQSHVSETGLKLCQPPSPSDVPQPLSPAAQATQPRPRSPSQSMPA